MPATISGRINGGGSGAVTVAGRIGAKIDQGALGVGGPIPDDVVGAATGLRLVVAAGNRVGKEQLPFRQTEGVALEDFRPDIGRDFALVQHGAPGDVSGVIGRKVRQELLAHSRAHTVGADQQFSVHARAVGEDRGDAVRILLDARERNAEAIACRRQRIPQRAIEPPPGAHGPCRLRFEVNATAAIEADDGVDLDAHGLVEIDADAAKDVDELRVGADAGAAAGEILGVALEHDGVPAHAAQEMRGQEPAERAADHQSASSGHGLNASVDRKSVKCISCPRAYDPYNRQFHSFATAQY
jgi:hypothetical protein